MFRPDSHNLTLLTPTYNRIDCLPALYRSLQEQKDLHFEWIIVDDGSTDGTAALVNSWIKSYTHFPVTLLQKANGGKHTAINEGVRSANGDFTFIVDSDDTLTPDAVKRIREWCAEVRGRKDLAGVAGCRGLPDGTRLGYFPKNKSWIEASNIDRLKLHMESDKAEIYRTSILKQFPFPVFSGERFLAESIVWDEIASRGYNLRWYRDIIYTTEYRPDGLTQNLDSHISQSFEGYTAVKKKGWSCYPFPYNWKALVSYLEDATLLGKGREEIIHRMDISPFLYRGALTTAKLKSVIKRMKAVE